LETNADLSLSLLDRATRV